MEEDDIDEEEGGTQVGLPNIFLCAILTKYHVQFTNQTVPTKLGVLPKQHLTYSNHKVPRVVSGNIPDLSGEVSTL